MTQERYCHYCQHMNFCGIYLHIKAISNLLMNNMRSNDIGQNGYQIIINEVAHNCENFKHFED